MNQEEIEKLVKKLNVRPSAEMYDKTLLDTLDAQQIQKKKLAASRPHLWRIIMENKITRYSAAAVIALATAVILFGPFEIPGNGGVVLAQVVQKMDEAKMIVHKEQRFYYELDKEEPFLKTDVIKHCCQNLGIVEEQYTTEGDLMHRAYVLGKAQQFIALLPKSKKYFKMPLKDSMAQIIDRLTPRGLVEHFMEIEHTKLGRKQIDGCEVEGFEAIDTEIWPMPDEFNFLFPVKQITWRFWIDVESSLPVRAEYEVVTDRGLLTGMKKLKVICKAYDFEFHQQAQTELFEPNIPEDYTELGLSDLIPIKAKAGLTGIIIIPAGFIFWRRHKRKRVMTS